MHKLCCWLLHLIDRIKFVRKLSRRILLRHYWFEHCDRSLRRGYIFCFFCDSMFELPDCDLSDHNWLNIVPCMSRRIVLRHYWFELRDRSLRRGYIFRFFSDSMSELPDWNLSGHNWFHFVHVVYCWFLLRHYRSDCSDRLLCSRLIFAYFFKRLFKLFIRNIFIFSVFN